MIIMMLPSFFLLALNLRWKWPWWPPLYKIVNYSVNIHPWHLIFWLSSLYTFLSFFRKKYDQNRKCELGTFGWVTEWPYKELNIIYICCFIFMKIHNFHGSMWIFMFFWRLVVLPKIKISWKCTHSRAIQYVDEFFFIRADLEKC